jgi:hypothetical protein
MRRGQRGNKKTKRDRDGRVVRTFEVISWMLNLPVVYANLFSEPLLERASSPDQTAVKHLD